MSDKEYYFRGKRIVLTDHAYMRCRERRVNIGILIENLAAILDGPEDGRTRRRWVGDLAIVYERIPRGAIVVTTYYRYEEASHHHDRVAYRETHDS